MHDLEIVFYLRQLLMLSEYLGLGNANNDHYANKPMQHTAIFQGCKNGDFQMKKCDIFLIFPQNKDRGYTLGGSYEYPRSMF